MYYLKLSIATLIALLTWLGFVFFAAFYGLWMRPIASPNDTEGFFQSVVEMIESENPGNSALVLIEDGAIAAEYFSNSSENIDRDTVFSTASMSKWITAIAVMKLIEDGVITLDEPISNHLTRWQLPESEYDNSQVTVRRLLSHTAGFTDGLGFGDYGAYEVLPTLEESLINPRASTDREVNMAVGNEPGTEFIYSGGGYLVLELLIEEVTKKSFEEYIQDTFFEPLNMTRSTYDYIGDVENNARSYARDGRVAPTYKYASSAATGFATSTEDLVKFVTALIPGASPISILSQSTIVTMREPHGRTSGIDVWGLGTILYSPTQSGDFVFGHDGGNDPAINSTARINPENGDAIIVLETGHPSLATNIGSLWILWQTGIPDVLDSDSTIKSMYLPLLLGVASILLAALAVVYRHRRKIAEG